MKTEPDVARADQPRRLTIATMTAADVPEVLAIEARSFSTAWPPNAFQNELRDNKLAHYFSGRAGGKLVAYGGIWVILEDAHVTTIAVAPDARGAGYGEEMLVHLLDEAIARGASWITLEVRASNNVAQKLYRKYGFTNVSTRRGYYSDDGEDALVMWAGNLKGTLYRARLAVLTEALARRVAARR